MESSHHLWGYVCALASAFLWAFAAISYKDIGRTVSPLGINIGKCVITVACISVLLLSQGWEPIGIRELIALAFSGILGIALGDTFFFMSVNRLKPVASMIITALIPVLVFIGGILFLHEAPSLRSCVGVTLTIGGIGIVLSSRRNGSFAPSGSAIGIACGVLSALCCASSVILSKFALTSSVSALQASLIRHGSGLILLAGWGMYNTDLKGCLKPLMTIRPTLLRLLVAAFLGSFLGTWLALNALKHAPVSTATVLNSTSPLFIIPLSYLMLRDQPSKQNIAGSIIAVIGVCLIMTGA